MISPVPYPAVPKVNLRTVRGIIGGLILLAAVLGLIFLPREFFFPVLLVYVLFGLAMWLVLIVMDRVPTAESIWFEEEEEIGTGEHEAVVPRHDEMPMGRRRRRRKKRPRGPLPTPTINRAVEEENQ
jgi:hypothetical protein